MRFFFTLLLIVGIGVFAMRSCGDKLLGGKLPVPGKISADEKKPERSGEQQTPPAAPVPVVPSAAVASPIATAGATANQGGVASAVAVASAAVVPASPPVATILVFKHRLVPPASQFAPLLAGSGQAGGVNGVSLIVDDKANAVLLRGPMDSVTALYNAIEALDVEALEAFADAWMLFVRGDRVRDFEASLEFGNGGGSRFASLSSAGFGVAVPLGALRARLDWLASNGVLEVIDRPQLRLSSGHKSEVSTGDEVPFPTTTLGVGGIAQTSIQFKRVGLSFAVKPLFLDGSRVRLEVEAENGLLGAVQKIGGIEVPSISRQSVTAAATLGYDEAMVLGGLETVRRERRFGLLGQKDVEQAGRLYVAIMLRSGYPKARPVIGPAPGLGIEVPGITGDPGKFDDQLLPFKGWKDAPDGKPTVGLPLPEK
jgi:hypothetical protein